MNKEKIKQILQQEIKFHNKEMEKHDGLYKKRKSKRQKEKFMKHLHKRYQTVNIAKKMGFEYCSCCGCLR